MAHAARIGPTDDPRIIGFSIASTQPQEGNDQVMTVMLDRRPTDAWLQLFNDSAPDLASSWNVHSVRIVGSRINVLGTEDSLKMTPPTLQALVKTITAQRQKQLASAAAHFFVLAKQASSPSEIRDAEIQQIRQIPDVQGLLGRVLQLTGLSFAAVARVTDQRWTALAVEDRANFGIVPGQDMILEKTLCNEVRQRGEPVIFSHASADAQYASHPLPRLYGFESHLSVPIRLRTGEFFGTLCALDPAPTPLNDQMIAEVRALAQYIGWTMSQLPTPQPSEQPSG